jgi:hypothetical protein
MHKPAEDDKFGPPAITKEDLDEIDFDRTNDKLTADQKLCQKATGLLTWIAQVRLDISYFARKCSRVMSAPKAEPVLKVLRAITLALLKKPHMGKTFSQSPLTGRHRPRDHQKFQGDFRRGQGGTGSLRDR